MDQTNINNLIDAFESQNTPSSISPATVASLLRELLACISGAGDDGVLGIEFTQGPGGVGVNVKLTKNSGETVYGTMPMASTTQSGAISLNDYTKFTTAAREASTAAATLGKMFDEEGKLINDRTPDRAISVAFFDGIVNNPPLERVGIGGSYRVVFDSYSLRFVASAGMKYYAAFPDSRIYNCEKGMPYQDKLYVHTGSGVMYRWNGLNFWPIEGIPGEPFGHAILDEDGKIDQENIPGNVAMLGADGRLKQGNIPATVANSILKQDNATQNLNDALQTGFYPYCCLGRPNLEDGSPADGYFSALVFRSANTDNAGYDVITQLAIDRSSKVRAGAVFCRFIFVKGDEKQYGDFRQLTTENSVLNLKHKVADLKASRLKSGFQLIRVEDSIRIVGAEKYPDCKPILFRLTKYSTNTQTKEEVRIKGRKIFGYRRYTKHDDFVIVRDGEIDPDTPCEDQLGKELAFLEIEGNPNDKMFDDPAHQVYSQYPTFCKTQHVINQTGRDEWVLNWGRCRITVAHLNDGHYKIYRKRAKCALAMIPKSLLGGKSEINRITLAQSVCPPVYFSVVPCPNIISESPGSLPTVDPENPIIFRIIL